MGHFKFDLLNHVAMKYQMVRFEHFVSAMNNQNSSPVNLENREMWSDDNEMKSLSETFASYISNINKYPIQIAVESNRMTDCESNEAMNSMSNIYFILFWWNIFIFCFVLGAIFYLLLAFAKSIVSAIGQRPKMIFVSEFLKRSEAIRCEWRLFDGKVRLKNNGISFLFD